MEELLVLIGQLGTIRQIPQFLFCDDISPKSMILVRKALYEFNSNAPAYREIDFILNSPGGSPDDAFRIITSLRSNFEVVNIILPFWAKSAATLLALGGSQIVMNNFSEMGPLDMQLATPREDSFDFETESALVDEYSIKRIEDRAREMYISLFLDLHSNEYIPLPKHELSQQLFTFISDFYDPLLSQINPYKIGKKKRKLDIGEHYARRLMIIYHPEIETPENFIDFLVNGCPDHGLVLDFQFVSQFLPYTKFSEIFGGGEYSNLLDKISLNLMDKSPDESYIGFIPVNIEFRGGGK